MPSGYSSTRLGQKRHRGEVLVQRHVYILRQLPLRQLPLRQRRSCHSASGASPMLDELLSSTLEELREKVRQGAEPTAEPAVAKAEASARCEEALRFFAGSHAFLGTMSDSRYSHMPCRVDNYVSEKQMWAVTLMVQPDAAARRRNILVRGEKLLFNHWAAPAHEGVPLPEHLRLGAASVSGNPEGDAGRGIYCRREVGWDRLNKNTSEPSTYLHTVLGCPIRPSVRQERQGLETRSELTVHVVC